MPASWNVSSKSTARAFVRTSTAIASSGTSSERTHCTTSAFGATRTSGPSGSDVRSFGASRFASSITCGVER
jgi:hypothetical protein